MCVCVHYVANGSGGNTPRLQEGYLLSCLRLQRTDKDVTRILGTSLGLGVFGLVGGMAALLVFCGREETDEPGDGSHTSSQIVEHFSKDLFLFPPSLTSRICLLVAADS